MVKSIVNEAFFWKHLADTLLESSGINKKMFYNKIKHVKYVWDLRDTKKMSEEIKKAVEDKTRYIKESFSEVISELNNNK